MADNVATFLLYIRLANIAISLFLLRELLPAVAFKSPRSLSRTMKAMFMAVLLFFLVEAVQLFRIFTGVEFELIQSAFTLLFLLLLLASVSEIRRGMMAHDHLVKRKLRGKLSDVE